MRLPLLRLAALLCWCPLLAHAQGAAADTTSRARLARLLLGLEYAMRDRPPADSAQPRISRTFDAATLAFFGGKSEAAGRTLDSLIGTVEPDTVRRAKQAAEADRALARVTSERLTLRTSTGSEIPYLLHVPTGKARARALLIALHGAGGDERMWMVAYGAGMLVSLADVRDVVVVSPLTTVMRDGATLDALVEAVAARTTIDRRRVLLLGHSLGAITAWRLATARGSSIAGVVCLASPCGGAAPGDSTAVPPLFVAAGALDPLAAPARVEAAAKAAQNAGRAVEYRVIPDRGHTLMVPVVLPTAMEWLAARSPAIAEYRRTP